jgi:hypothetical protein
MRKRALLVVIAAGLTGCAPLAPRPATDRSRGVKPSQPAREPDCSRRFDDNDAGFQTCQEGQSPASE